MSTCLFLWPQADKNRLTAESKCGDAGNRASKVTGYLAPRVLEKSTYRNLPWTSKVKFKGNLSLGLCYGNCTKSGKKLDRFAKRKLSFLEGKLMFNSMHCVSFFRSLEGRGKGKRVSNYGSVFPP